MFLFLWIIDSDCGKTVGHYLHDRSIQNNEFKLRK